MKKTLISVIPLLLLLVTVLLSAGCDREYKMITPPASDSATPDGHVHEYSLTVVEPSCEAGGRDLYLCDCGDFYEENVTPPTHSFALSSTPPDCIRDGANVYTCIICGYSYNEVTVPALGHSYTSFTVGATCTEMGYTQYNCSACGDIYMVSKDPATGHDYTSATVAPTCVSEGYVLHTCTVCGDSYTDSATAMIPHSYTHSYVAPTCTEEGGERYTCTVCAYSFTENRVAAAGHKYTDKVVSPTATDKGYTVHTCSVCKDSYTDSYTSPTGGVVVDEAFFDSAVFLGDSVSLMLENYHARTGAFGGARFFSIPCYSAYHAVYHTLLVNCNGTDMAPEDAIASTGADKVFIMLGTNDLGWRTVEQAVGDVGILVSRIREKCPGITVYLQSMLPIYTAGQKGSLNNANADAYNARLAAYAQESGCIYIDIASHMKDSTGGLAAEYTSDSFVHLTYAACEVWKDVLFRFLGI